ncbi:MAG: peptidylprolyl isomerase [Candidatus Paceibacterota bacterium]|jgi:cyclophilin family peptidyl-prolyl cis-trans isomerase
MFLSKRFSPLTSSIFLLLLSGVTAILYFTVAKAEKIADQWSAISPAAVSQSSVNEALIRTSLGDIRIKLLEDKAPKTVENFVKLVKDNFYDNTKFHRIIPDFMIQGGDPLTKDDTAKERWGTGGPGYNFADEPNNVKMVRGVLAMANSGPDTNGSQFFIITTAETPWLQGKHTVFGQVIAGMDIVDKISALPTDDRDVSLQPVVVQEIILR